MGAAVLGAVYLEIVGSDVTGEAECADDDPTGTPAYGTIHGTVVDGVFSGAWRYVFFGYFGAEASLSGTVVDDTVTATLGDSSGTWWALTEGTVAATRE